MLEKRIRRERRWGPREGERETEKGRLLENGDRGNPRNAEKRSGWKRDSDQTYHLKTNTCDHQHHSSSSFSSSHQRSCCEHYSLCGDRSRA